MIISSSSVGSYQNTNKPILTRHSPSINPQRAELFWENINIVTYFITEMLQVVKTFFYARQTILSCTVSASQNLAPFFQYKWCANWRPVIWSVHVILTTILTAMSGHRRKFLSHNTSKMKYIHYITSEWARWRLKSPASWLFAQLFAQAQIKEKKSQLRVTGLCEGNPPVTGEFPSQRTSNAENVSFDDVIMKRFGGCPSMKMQTRSF